MEKFQLSILLTENNEVEILPKGQLQKLLNPTC